MDLQVFSATVCQITTAARPLVPEPAETLREVEGLPWVPARPTLGSRFFPGLCQVPVNKWCSLGSRVFLGFPWVPVETQEVCPGFCQICGLPWVLPDLGSTPGSGRQEHRRAQC